MSAANRFARSGHLLEDAKAGKLLTLEQLDELAVILAEGARHATKRIQAERLKAANAAKREKPDPRLIERRDKVKHAAEEYVGPARGMVRKVATDTGEDQRQVRRWLEEKGEGR